MTVPAGDPLWCCGRTACGPPAGCWSLHLAAVVFGVAIGTLLVPPLVERAGWRICLAVGLFLALLLVPVSPMHPLLLLATHPAGESVGAAAGLIAATGATLIGVTAFLASRLP